MAPKWEIRFSAFPVLVAGLAIACGACAGMAIREAESNLGARLHPHEIAFEVTASNRAVDPRVADAVNAAIEQTVDIHGGLYSSERLEPLAYAVAVQTGVAPGLQSLCDMRGGGSCCSLLCRVMETNAKGVMIETRDDLDRAFRLFPFDRESRGDPTRRCAKGPLPNRLQCLRGLLTAEPSHVKVGPFLVSGRITSALANAFDVQAQIARVQAAIDEEASREQEVRRKRLCIAKVAEAGSAVSVWKGDVAKVRGIWENAKGSCGDLWSPVDEQRMDNMVRESARQGELAVAAEEAESNSREVDAREGGRSQSVTPAPDPETVLRSLQAGCDKNDLPACIRLGEMFETGGDGVSKDEKQAFRLFNRACEGGSVPGCGCLGRMYLGGKATPKDTTNGRLYLERACGEGYTRACRELGDVYFDGIGVPVDKVRAQGLWRKACDSEDLPGCTSLGFVFLSGAEGVPIDRDRARSLFEHACSGADAAACRNLGVIYRDGLGIDRNELAAARFFEKACDGNVATACLDAAIMLARANVPDRVKMRALLRRACELGNEVACDILRNSPDTAAKPAGRRRPEARPHPHDTRDSKALQDRLLGP